MTTFKAPPKKHFDLSDKKEEKIFHKGKWRNVYMGPDCIDGKPCTVYGRKLHDTEAAASIHRQEILSHDCIIAGGDRPDWVKYVRDIDGRGIRACQVTAHFALPIGGK